MALKAEVKRDGVFQEIEVEAVVPGDVLRIRAGDIIPADALILQSTAFTAGEAALTGEPYPVPKRPGVAADPDDASNALFRGAVAQTGEAIALAVKTGPATVFGAAASALAQAQARTPFERDLREFGLVIARLTLALVVVVLAVRVVFGRPVLDSLLFAVALAVGLTPELLPMITTVTLSRGALRMAGRKVIVKRLASIHDLGAMSVLCTDKTGTLTSAEITLARSLDPDGAEDARIAIGRHCRGTWRRSRRARCRAGGVRDRRGLRLDSRGPAGVRFFTQARLGACRRPRRSAPDRQGRAGGGAGTLHASAPIRTA